MAIIKTVFDKKHRVVGCGYCKFEKAALNTCTKHDSKVNQAALGCEDYKHYSDK